MSLELAPPFYLQKSALGSNFTTYTWQPIGITVKEMYNVDFSPTVFFSSHFAYQTPSSLEPKITKYYYFVELNFF